MIRNRPIPKSRQPRPENNAERGLQLRERDRVTEAPPGEKRLDGGAVQAGDLADPSERPTLQLPSDVRGEAMSSSHLDRSIDDELSANELDRGVGQVVDGQSAHATTPGHHIDLTDTPHCDTRSNRRSTRVVECREEPAPLEEVDVANQRDQLIGQRVHALIAAHLRAGIVPESRQVWVATSRVFAQSPIPQNHGARQRAACGVGVYFSMFFRSTWEFIGAEVSLGAGRVDLLWRTAADLVVIDEVKMAGASDHIDDASTVAQIQRYSDAGLAEFGDRFAGVRLLPLGAPGRALWCAPGAQRVPLADAEGAA